MALSEPKESSTLFLFPSKNERATQLLAEPSKTTPFVVALISGGLAGTSVDVALYPMDTIKTRLQSPKGFLKSGGFRGIYRGLGAVVVGSAPGSALFFSTYETMKPHCLAAQEQYGIFPTNPSLSHMMAASLGETVACLVRVPTEVIKSNMQTNPKGTIVSTVRLVLSEPHGNNIFGSYLGSLYRGYGITLSREVPFALIQYSIYERCKLWLSQSFYQREITTIEAAACGSFGGAIAAALTTPLDVLKTRLMIGKDFNGVEYRSAADVLRTSIQEEGATSLLRGIQPRVMSISIGGFAFFGVYEFSRSRLMSLS